MAGETQNIPLGVPAVAAGTDDGAGHEESQDLLPESARYGAHYSQYDGGCCHSSTHKHDVSPAVGIAKSPQRSVLQLAQNRSYWGIPPRSPMRSPPKPGALRVPQSVTPDNFKRAVPGTRAQARPLGRTGLPSLPERPLPPIPTTTRYSVFPKPSTHPKRPPAIGSQPIRSEGGHSESVTRNLSQQRRLSALVSSDPPSAVSRTDLVKENWNPVQPDSAISPTTTTSRAASQQGKLDSFTKELEEYVIGAVSDLSTSASSVADTQISVQTVKEFLPYRQQFREAGLAVTSADQHTKVDKGVSTGEQNKGMDDNTLGQKSSISTGYSGGNIIKRCPEYPASPRFNNEPARRMDKAENKAREIRVEGLHRQQSSPVPYASGGQSPMLLEEGARSVSEGCWAMPSVGSLAFNIKTQKSLPVLPSEPSPSQSRQAVPLPSRTNRALAEHYHSPIPEGKGSSPVKVKTPVNKTYIIRQKDGVIMEARETESRITQATAVMSTSSGARKLELPETWKHAISTPSSFQKALDEVVRKLDDMGDNKTAGVLEKDRPVRKRSPTKPTSPSQRLQRVVELRRRRLAEAARRDVETSGEPIPVVAVQDIPRPPESAPRRATKLPSKGGDDPTQEDKDISDRAVLRGLQIVCAASADTEVDAWIRAKIGLRLRRFLADLSTFEGLSQEGIAALGDQSARRKRLGKRRLTRESKARKTKKAGP